MARYRNVSLSFWTDPKVEDYFTPEDKYFYLYLITNSHTNICGCYELSMRQMERETGYSVETIERLLERMESFHRVIRYSEETKEVLLLNWHKHNWSTSDKVEKAVLSVAEYIKNERFKEYVVRTAFGKYHKAENREQIQKTETETETDTGTGSVAETDTDTDTDVCIGYTYPIDTISETAPAPPTNLSNLFVLYENCGGTFSNYAVEEIQCLEQDYGSTWLEAAIRRAADRSHVTIAYIKGILKSWRANGGIDDGSKASKEYQKEQERMNMIYEWAVNKSE